MQTTAKTHGVGKLSAYLPIALLLLVGTSGCVGASAQLMYVLFGHKTEAECSALKNRRVALVTVAEDEAFGPTPLNESVSRMVMMRLVKNVRKIDMVPQAEIEDWVESNSWGRLDLEALGAAVEADVVVKIELSDYRIHEGATIHKGHVSYNVEVYDMEDEGRIVFQRGPEFFDFPRDGRPRSEAEDRKFEVFYLTYLTDELSRYFYSYDSTETAAIDSALMH